MAAGPLERLGQRRQRRHLVGRVPMQVVPLAVRSPDERRVDTCAVGRFEVDVRIADVQRGVGFQVRECPFDVNYPTLPLA